MSKEEEYTALEETRDYLLANIDKMDNELKLVNIVEITLGTFSEYVDSLLESDMPKELKNYSAMHLNNILVSLLVSLYTSATQDHKLALKIAAHCASKGGEFHKRKEEK